MNHRFKNHDAATLLGVDTRTVKRWMKQPALREALGAVRHGKQWRIPHPGDIENWRIETRWRLKKAGVELPLKFRRGLRNIAERNGRCGVEPDRLWVAALMKVLAERCIERGITPTDCVAINLLRRATFKILAPLQPCEMDVGKLKEQFSACLSERGLSTQEIAAVMRYWPEEEHFRRVPHALERADLEKIRRQLDYTQAICELKHLGQKPTQENIGPLLHNGLTAQLNDTGEQLSGIVFGAQSSEQLRNIARASAYNSMAGQIPPVVTIESQKMIEEKCRRIAAAVTIDFRQPQQGIRRRTVQKRHLQKHQRQIINAVYQVRATFPGADTKPKTGKTPVLGSADDRPAVHR